MDTKKMLEVLRAAEVDQATYVDILYKRGPRMAITCAAARVRLQNTRDAISQLQRAP